MNANVLSVKVEVKRVDLSRGRAELVNDPVVVEAPVNLHVNRRYVATLLALPDQLKELCVGWLLSHAIIKKVDEILNIQVKGNLVRVNCLDEVEMRLRVASRVSVVRSSCGSLADDFYFSIDRISKPFVASDYTVKAGQLLRFVSVLNRKSSLFRLTGGTHSAALFHEGVLVAFAEDVGRHNAVDKVIGSAALRRTDFSKCVLVSSGRQPAGMVLKAARVGIPIVASIAGPIYSGVEAARKTGVTLVCFVRGRRMNVYSFHERVVL